MINRLGAIFANSKYYEKAIDCYESVMKLKKDSVRTLFNSAISHFNLENYQMALKLLLTALDYHTPVQNEITDSIVFQGHSNIWNAINLVCHESQNQDLITAANQRDSSSLKSLTNF